MSAKVDLKVVLLGKEYGGKTSLVERFINSRFNASIPYQNTIGAAFGAKSLTVGGNKSVTLGIWDTAGSERYEAMSRIYYRGAGAAVVCYDLTDTASWERAKFWIKEVRGHEENCKVYLCGTKKDLVESKSRGIDHFDSTDYADVIGAKLFETSSKTGENVDELFQAIADEFYTMPKPIMCPSEVPNRKICDLKIPVNKVPRGANQDQSGNSSIHMMQSSPESQNKQCSGCANGLPWNWNK